MGLETYLRRTCLLLFAVLLFAFAAWLAWRAASSKADSPASVTPVIEKHPVIFAQRFFDPAAPPPDMPPLGEGEEAECDSNFVSDANVSGRMQRINSTNATAIVTQVKVSLELRVTIWVPNGATQHVIEHEEGHRQISEHYYATADKVA